MQESETDHIVREQMRERFAACLKRGQKSFAETYIRYLDFPLNARVPPFPA
jgi:hypothetical protein